MGKKYNYLTEEEAKMNRDEVNLQIALGLKSCNSLADVVELLNDVRRHEIDLIKGKKLNKSFKDLMEKKCF